MIVYIPSKDRAAQLSILLNSIFKYHNDIFNQICVYYTYSNEQFKLGYEKVINQFKDRVNFIPSIDFGTDFLDVLKKDSLFFIITDDSVVYRKIDFNTSDVLELFTDENILNVSLRIGLNTTVIDYSNPDSAQQYINIERTTDKFIIWDWVKTNIHLGHGFSCDGNIYRSNDILNLLKHGNKDLRAMECRGRMLAYRRRMACQQQSSIVNSSNNQVMNGPMLKNGVIYDFSIQQLNDMLLDGYQLSYEIPENITSVQQELNIKAEKNDI
jgi:hypothetical protein